MASQDRSLLQVLRIAKRTLNYVVVATPIVVVVLWIAKPITKIALPLTDLPIDFWVALSTSVIAILFVSTEGTFLRLKAIDSKLEGVNNNLLQMQRIDPEIVEGVAGVVECIGLDMESVPGEDQSLTVLGLTLDTAWPTITRGFFAKPETMNYSFRFFCLDPDFIDENSDILPPSWANQARISIQGIEEYKCANDDDLARRSIRIELIKYRSFPAIHGFSMNNGTLYIACSRWNKGSAAISTPDHPYERFVNTDRSPRAMMHRELFENWVDRAMTTAA